MRGLEAKRVVSRVEVVALSLNDVIGSGVYLLPAAAAAAVVVQTAVVLPLALTGSFAGLAALSVVARLASYISTAAAIPALRKKLPDGPATVRLPFGPAIPIAAVVVSAFLVASATALDLVAGATALVAGLAVYALRRKSPPGEARPYPVG